MPVFTVAGEATFVGRVLGERERNLYHDSDFLARVWVGESPEEGGHSTEVEYATTRAWCGKAGCVVDADEQVREWARQERASQVAAAIARSEARERITPKIGSQVRVVGGRKYKGVHGSVCWIGVDPFKVAEHRRYAAQHLEGVREPLRIGILLGDDSKIFVPAEYLEIWVEGKYLPSFDRK